MGLVLAVAIGVWVLVAGRYATGGITPSVDNSVAMAVVIVVLLVSIAVLRSSLRRQRERGEGQRDQEGAA